MKRILAMLLAAMLVLSMGVVAFAEGETEVGTAKKLIEEAAKENANIKLTTDITLNTVLNVAAGVTIDGNGKTITGADGNDAFTKTGFNKSGLNLININGNNVTLKNITVTTGSKNRNAVHVFNVTDVVLDGVTINNTNTDTDGGAPLIINNSVVTVKNNFSVTLGENSWYGINVDNKEGSASLTLDATADVSFSAVNETTQAFICAETDTETITNNTGKVFSQTLEQEGKKFYGKLVDPVAKIGEVGYATLAEAVAAAENGNTITLLKDASGAGIGTFKSANTNKGFTIDFNNHTYTITGPAVGSSGTLTQGFHLEWNGDKDNNHEITFKNGTITSTDNSGVYMLIQNYCDLTLDNMILDGQNIGTNRYTVSNNNGNVLIKDTKIIAPTNGFAFDACRYASYPAVNVTVSGNSEINGKVEMSGTVSEGQSCALIINDGTFNGDIVKDQNAGGTISITGGTFTSDPSGYVANGYSVQTNKIGEATSYYTVVEAPKAGETTGTVLPTTPSEVEKVETEQKVTVNEKEVTVKVENTNSADVENTATVTEVKGLETVAAAAGNANEVKVAISEVEKKENVTSGDEKQPAVNKAIEAIVADMARDGVVAEKVEYVDITITAGNTQVTNLGNGLLTFVINGNFDKNTKVYRYHEENNVGSAEALDVYNGSKEGYEVVDATTLKLYLNKFSVYAIATKATVTVEEPETRPDPCDHDFDANGKCKDCGIIVIDHTASKPAQEANPNTGAESAVAVVAAVAALALAGAVVSKK